MADYSGTFSPSGLMRRRIQKDWPIESQGGMHLLQIGSIESDAMLLTPQPNGSYSFIGATYLKVSDTFSDLYDNYCVVLNINSYNSSAEIGLILFDNPTDVIGGEWVFDFYSKTVALGTTTTRYVIQTTGRAIVHPAPGANVSDQIGAVIHISRPYLWEPTYIQATASSLVSSNSSNLGATISETQALQTYNFPAKGFKLNFGTTNGQLAVYGLGS